ncbi:MAG TPA: RidA family protein [Candidatus Kapabacteria bacterium]|nr:RidA family protein [Candidatus Kapabacteria bacterium]
MKFIDPKNWKAPKGYSNGVLCPPGGSALYIAGQVGWDEHGVFRDGFILQYRQALSNVVEVVLTAGGKTEDISRLVFYVTDKQEYLENIKEVGKIYREIMGKHFPAMALVEVNALLEDKALVEIEGNAVIYK